jgi:hypothetical protein
LARVPRGKGTDWWEVTIGVFMTNSGLSANPRWWRYMFRLPSAIAAIGIEFNDDHSPTGEPILHIGS